MSEQPVLLQEEAIGKLEMTFELEETLDHSATFLKVRLFPSDPLLQQFTINGTECEFTDEFLDDCEFTYAQRQELVRRRGAAVVYRTRHANVTIGCHVHREAAINTIPESTRCFLSYAIKRQYLQPRSSELLLDAYLDTMTSPFAYQVLSIRNQLTDSDPTTINETYTSLLKQLACLWGDVVPVGFSKFMFALKCLPDSEEYEDIFCQFDNVNEVITKNIDCLLSTTESETSHHLYIWTLQEQLDRLSMMREYGKFDDAQCRAKLAKVYDRIVSGTTKIVRCDPYDI
jgi:hypothetical protein